MYTEGIVRAPTLPGCGGGLRRRHSLPEGTLKQAYAAATADEDASDNCQDTIIEEPRDQNSSLRRHVSVAVDDTEGLSDCCALSELLGPPPAGAPATAAKEHKPQPTQAGWFRHLGISLGNRGRVAAAPAAGTSGAAEQEAATSSSSCSSSSPGAALLAAAAVGDDNGSSSVTGGASSAEEPADGVVHAFAAAAGPKGSAAQLAAVGAQLPQAATVAVGQIMSKIKPGSRPRTKSE